MNLNYLVRVGRESLLDHARADLRLAHIGEGRLPARERPLKLLEHNQIRSRDVGQAPAAHAPGALALVLFTALVPGAALVVAVAVLAVRAAAC